MPDSTHYDVIGSGSGAGGGTLTHRLAPSGRRILLLERGGYLPAERDNWDSSAVFVRGIYRAPEFWYDKHGDRFPPEVNYYVGGNTKFYGAALFRLRPRDFAEIRHHGGLSPTWPLSYDDFEPYYTEAERLYLVHGRRGADPTEGPASAEYAHPPVRHEPRIQQLNDDLEKLGLHPFHLPIGVDLDQDADGGASHTSACIRCDRVLVDKDGDIHLTLDERNNVAAVGRLRRKLEGMLGHLGMHPHLLDHSIYLHKTMPIGATAHQAGTVRFGTEPAISALDVNCKAHDLDNLYVVDTSFFPSVGAVNPSLTAMANALRVGDHIIERLGGPTSAERGAQP